jgi:rhodanese-related sulfurtransferase
MRLVPFLLVMLVACGGAESTAPPPVLGPEAHHVSGREARALVADGAVLLDVRSEFEYAANHLDGAINIPVDELSARMSELPPETPVVVYCLSGHRSAEAGRILTGGGRDDVSDLGSIANY